MAGYLVELNLHELSDTMLGLKLAEARGALALDTTTEFFCKLYNLTDEQVKVIKASLTWEVERLEGEMRRRKLLIT